MKLKSFSKINLSLTVNKKFKRTKLHDIQSYFCLIDLYDLLEVKKISGRKDLVKFDGKFAKYVNRKSNSIIKALNVLREKNFISDYYSVLVHKRTPVFSGMGGGTSNAACIIKYLTNNKINKDLFNILDQKIGSDLRLFFYKQGFLKNLKTVNRLKKKLNLFFLLVYPNIKCSTTHIYSKVKRYSKKSKSSYVKIKDKKKFIQLISNEGNDLQSIVERKYPIIKKLIGEIGQKKGCYFSRMTGSGSVCYGVFKSHKSAKAALNRVKLKHPKYWLSVAKTI